MPGDCKPIPLLLANATNAKFKCAESPFSCADNNDSHLVQMDSPALHWARHLILVQAPTAAIARNHLAVPKRVGMGAELSA